MKLSIYHRKRKFNETPEPRGKVKESKKELRFMVQKHDASHLHYDFRLEWEGVLKSFALPKGPSLDPSVKHLAIQTEDHPLEYAKFEGHIPEGNYGAGDVIVWDQGNYRASEAKNKKENAELLKKGFKKGHLSIELFGKKLKGNFHLVRTKKIGGKDQWLFFKAEDEFANKNDITQKTESVRTHKKLPRDEKEKNAQTSISQGPMPQDLRPMLTTLTDTPFSKAGWIFEEKYDGYRVISEIKKGEVHLFSRHRKSFDEKFKRIKKTLEKIKHDVILDGEVVALINGKLSFEGLQNAGEEGAELHYFIFDLLYLDGYDLREVPLLERKKLLRKLFKDSKFLTYSKHKKKDGETFFKEVEKEGGEGIIAKKADSLYQEGGRGEDWLKIKTEKRQEVVIGGFTVPQKSRKFFGALVVGVYNRSGELEYVGHTGGGFNDKSLNEIYKKLKKLSQKTCPFKTTPKTNAKATWVKPVLVAEVKFREWTKENIMRQPIFLGLREDKRPKEVRKEVEKSTKKLVKKKGEDLESQIEFTHLDKILWPKIKGTKKDLIDYYKFISPILLPYLKDRPENLLRHPHGVKGASFYQKNVDPFHLPDFAESIRIYSESNEAEIKYLICNNQETLLYMAQLGCIEMHPWNSRRETIESPDYMIFDVDPSRDNFQEVIEVTLAIKEILDQVVEKTYVKTSGKTGLHILVPVGAKYEYEVIKEFAHVLMQLVNKKLPKLTSLERHPHKRHGKVYLDYLQNRAGQTLAAPYSLRATPEATIATPLEWKEVNKRLDPKKFNLKTIKKRLKQKGDLWKNILKEKVDLNKALKKLKKLSENE